MIGEIGIDKGTYGHFQHSPMIVSSLMDVESSEEAMVVVTGERFSEEISKIRSRGNLLQQNSTRLH